MNLVEALTTLAKTDAAVFTTADAAVRLGIANGHASVILARLAVSGQLIRLRRAVWARPGSVGSARATRVPHSSVPGIRVPAERVVPARDDLAGAGGDLRGVSGASAALHDATRNRLDSPRATVVLLWLRGRGAGWTPGDTREGARRLPVSRAGAIAVVSRFAGTRMAEAVQRPQGSCHGRACRAEETAKCGLAQAERAARTPTRKVSGPPSRCAATADSLHLACHDPVPLDLLSDD